MSIHYYADGTPCECDKIKRMHYKNGDLRQEKPIVNGKIHGVLKCYRPSWNARKGHALDREISYKNGKKNGLHKQYSPSGDLLNEISYKNGKMHGPYRSYFQSGFLKYETIFAKNVRHGIKRIFGTERCLEREFLYINGSTRVSPTIPRLAVFSSCPAENFL